MMLMMSPPITSLTKNTSGTSTTTTPVSSLNSLTAINPTNTTNQEQQLSSVYMVPTVPNSFSYSQNAIRKRKVKFTIQLAIEELLSVPYLNAVLFCKVRQCDGGNHVSYSSKKEVSNSSVLWSDDSAIQFDVKTVQSYVTLPNPLDPNVIIGYDPCLCRISVRKELRGGKSYQKIGYVDYNLTDFISKYHELNENEFCVNRILKEYDSAGSASSSSSKKNQQRLDNSYLKIKIKILDSNLPPSQINITSVVAGACQQQTSTVTTPPSPPSSNEFLINPSTPSNTTSSASAILSNSNQSPSLLAKSTNSPSNQNYTPTHSRHSSSSTTNSILISNNVNNSSLSSVFVNGHYRSCSNGSIKSNVSFEFLTKNRTKKLMEELQSTTSSSSLTAVLNNQMNQLSEQATSSSSLLLTPTNPSCSSPVATATTTSTSIINKIEPTNMRLIETRVDANEIINQIENELANRFSNLKQAQPTSPSVQQANQDTF